MSEQSNGPEIVRQELGEPIVIHPAELNHEYGVPEEAVPIVAQRIHETLLTAGIDPETVVFAGYNRRDENPDQAKLRAQRDDLAYSMGDIALEEVEYDDEVRGVVDLVDELQTAYGWDASALSTKPRYDLSGPGELLAPADADSNPIHYAGTVPDATIGVYDKNRLHEIDANYNPDSPGTWVIIHATLDELDRAKVAELYPRYMA